MKNNLDYVREYEVNKSAYGVKSLAYTVFEKSILAVGYNRGLIEVYDCKEKVQLLQKLESHKEAVYALRFSPWMDNQTLILASVSEELCFWNITHILNNPMDGGNLRRSQRFRRRLSKSSNNNTLDTSAELTNGGDNIHNISPTTINGNHLTITGISNGHNTSNGNGQLNGLSDVISPISQLNQSFGRLQLSTPTSPVAPIISTASIVPPVVSRNPWIGKCGASTKPELLACIKFVGNAAEKIYTNQAYTKFITIDSDGEIYYLDINYGDSM